MLKGVRKVRDTCWSVPQGTLVRRSGILGICLPPPASYISFNPVLSEVSKAGASGQGENRKGNAGVSHCCGLGVAG